MMCKKFILITTILSLLLTGCIPASTTSEEAMEELTNKNDLLTQNVSDITELTLKIQEIKMENSALKMNINVLEEDKEKLLKVLNDKDTFIDQLLHDNKNSTPSDYLFDYYKEHFEPTMLSQDAESTIADLSSKVIDLISNKDMDGLSQHVHPTLGVRFTPYTTVNLHRDLCMPREDIQSFFYDTNEYLWGAYDGIDKEIRFTKEGYFDRFIYNKDYKSYDKIGFNISLGASNNMENQYAIYHNAITAEYYLEGTEDLLYMDASSLRLVFQSYEDEWYLVGIIHNEWTI